MGNRGFRVFVGASIIALLAAVAVYSYNVGVARGIAESARIVAAPAGAAPIVAVWPRLWGFGPGFVPILPLVFIFLLVLAFRGWTRAAVGRGVVMEVVASHPGPTSGTAVHTIVQLRRQVTRSELDIAMRTQSLSLRRAMRDLNIVSQRFGEADIVSSIQGLR